MPPAIHEPTKDVDKLGDFVETQFWFVVVHAHRGGDGYRFDGEFDGAFRHDSLGLPKHLNRMPNRLFDEIFGERQVVTGKPVLCEFEAT
jgi:hypothetical protein